MTRLREKRKLEAEAHAELHKVALTHMESLGISFVKQQFQPARTDHASGPRQVSIEGELRWVWTVQVVVENPKVGELIEAYEEEVTIGSYLEMMFPDEGTPPPWDSHGSYRSKNLVAFLYTGGKTYSRWLADVSLEEKLTLVKTIEPTPTVAVFVDGSKELLDFLERQEVW
eukprot:Trichotokara_eunicae@DN1103_c0_g1_i1.p1